MVDRLATCHFLCEILGCNQFLEDNWVGYNPSKKRRGIKPDMISLVEIIPTHDEINNLPRNKECVNWLYFVDVKFTCGTYWVSSNICKVRVTRGLSRTFYTGMRKLSCACYWLVVVDVSAIESELNLRFQRRKWKRTFFSSQSISMCFRCFVCRFYIVSFFKRPCYYDWPIFFFFSLLYI